MSSSKRGVRAARRRFSESAATAEHLAAAVSNQSCCPTAPAQSHNSPTCPSNKNLLSQVSHYVSSHQIAQNASTLSPICSPHCDIQPRTHTRQSCEQQAVTKSVACKIQTQAFQSLALHAMNRQSVRRYERILSSRQSKRQS